jgi:hypothetical protein
VPLFPIFQVDDINPGFIPFLKHPRREQPSQLDALLFCLLSKFLTQTGFSGLDITGKDDYLS